MFGVGEPSARSPHAWIRLFFRGFLGVTTGLTSPSLPYKEELAQVASISTMDAGQFGKRTIITYNDSRSLNAMAGDVQVALKTGNGEITKPVSASEEALSTLAQTSARTILQ